MSVFTLIPSPKRNILRIFRSVDSKTFCASARNETITHLLNLAVLQTRVVDLLRISAPV